MRLLIMGPPGAGKGTQACGIATHLGVPAISTGEIFRSHIAAGTDLGKQVDGLIRAGNFVPDEVTEAIVFERLGAEDCADGFLLDGFPRTMHQVHALDDHLDRTGERIDVALSLVADADEMVRRIRRRAELENRPDDDEETVRHRLDVYDRETAPLLDEYRQRGILVEVDALGGIDEVADRIRDALSTALVD